jgi:hypothetical protein
MPMPSSSAGRLGEYRVIVSDGRELMNYIYIFEGTTRTPWQFSQALLRILVRTTAKLIRRCKVAILLTYI